MKLFVGLGNPGKEYAHTRHNVGFDVLLEFQKTFSGNFSEFTLDKSHHALVSMGRIEQEKVVLVLPQGYYNTSGTSVSGIMSYYKISASELFVVHDDLDIPTGKLRISKDANAAGNKGVLSIIESIGTKNFTRIRIGIATPQASDAKDFVLERFSKTQALQIQESKKLAQQAMIDCVAMYPAIEKVQNIYN
ncbi:aminoacyl-tRNA hydrolase [Candidatus Falkowbacteria bacterium]|nr:aminoacyl-tRNA hydrolase [Candidatus Falkowbacteria bacterium]